jgi:16S rRNA (cytosine967-C5)-methyltransferase
MKMPFRDYHALEIFRSIEIQAGPLDLFLRNYFHAHKAVGSKDRKEIAETVYGITRWRGLLDHLIGPFPSWEKRLALYANFSPADHAHDPNIPLPIRLSFPSSFFNILSDQLGEEKAIAFCQESNETAPTTVRVNALKISRDALLEQWKNAYAVSACKESVHGIVFHKKINFFALPEFKMGLFEVQDEASQLIADLVDAKPGEQIMDFCAGSGGKTLAIAPKLGGKGQLYVHDVRAGALREAKKRLYRAGIQNAQVLSADAPYKRSLKGDMDWVLVDAPCTGTGTLRRNPDQKWKFEESMLHRLIDEQRLIVREALNFLKPNGKIVYATCSVLPLENEAQAEYFEKTYGLKREGNVFSSFPKRGSMDGFFGVVFTKNPLLCKNVNI